MDRINAMRYVLYAPPTLDTHTLSSLLSPHPVLPLLPLSPTLSHSSWTLEGRKGGWSKWQRGRIYALAANRTALNLSRQHKCIRMKRLQELQALNEPLNKSYLDMIHEVIRGLKKKITLEDIWMWSLHSTKPKHFMVSPTTQTLALMSPVLSSGGTLNLNHTLHALFQTVDLNLSASDACCWCLGVQRLLLLFIMSLQHSVMISYILHLFSTTPVQ